MKTNKRNYKEIRTALASFGMDKYGISEALGQMHQNDTHFDIVDYNLYNVQFIRADQTEEIALWGKPDLIVGDYHVYGESSFPE